MFLWFSCRAEAHVCPAQPRMVQKLTQVLPVDVVILVMPAPEIKACANRHMHHPTASPAAWANTSAHNYSCGGCVAGLKNVGLVSCGLN